MFSIFNEVKYLFKLFAPHAYAHHSGSAEHTQKAVPALTRCYCGVTATMTGGESETEEESQTAGSEENGSDEVGKLREEMRKEFDLSREDADDKFAALRKAISDLKNGGAQQAAVSPTGRPTSYVSHGTQTDTSTETADMGVKTSVQHDSFGAPSPKLEPAANAMVFPTNMPGAGTMARNDAPQSTTSVDSAAASSPQQQAEPLARVSAGGDISDGSSARDDTMARPVTALLKSPRIPKKTAAAEASLKHHGVDHAAIPPDSSPTRVFNIRDNCPRSPPVMSIYADDDEDDDDDTSSVASSFHPEDMDELSDMNSDRFASTNQQSKEKDGDYDYFRTLRAPGPLPWAKLKALQTVPAVKSYITVVNSTVVLLPGERPVQAGSLGNASSNSPPSTRPSSPSSSDSGYISHENVDASDEPLKQTGLLPISTEEVSMDTKTDHEIKPPALSTDAASDGVGKMLQNMAAADMKEGHDAVDEAPITAVQRLQHLADSEMRDTADSTETASEETAVMHAPAVAELDADMEAGPDSGVGVPRKITDYEPAEDLPMAEPEPMQGVSTHEQLDADLAEEQGDDEDIEFVPALHEPSDTAELDEGDTDMSQAPAPIPPSTSFPDMPTVFSAGQHTPFAFQGPPTAPQWGGNDGNDLGDDDEVTDMLENTVEDDAVDPTTPAHDPPESAPISFDENHEDCNPTDKLKPLYKYVGQPEAMESLVAKWLELKVEELDMLADNVDLLNDMKILFDPDNSDMVSSRVDLVQRRYRQLVHFFTGTTSEGGSQVIERAIATQLQTSAKAALRLMQIVKEDDYSRTLPVIVSIDELLERLRDSTQQPAGNDGGNAATQATGPNSRLSQTAEPTDRPTYTGKGKAPLFPEQSASSGKPFTFGSSSASVPFAPQPSELTPSSSRSVAPKSLRSLQGPTPEETLSLGQKVFGQTAQHSKAAVRAMPTMTAEQQRAGDLHMHTADLAKVPSAMVATVPATAATVSGSSKRGRSTFDNVNGEMPTPQPDSRKEPKLQKDDIDIARPSERGRIESEEATLQSSAAASIPLPADAEFLMKPPPGPAVHDKSYPTEDFAPLEKTDRRNRADRRMLKEWMLKSYVYIHHLVMKHEQWDQGHFITLMGQEPVQQNLRCITQRFDQLIAYTTGGTGNKHFEQSRIWDTSKMSLTEVRQFYHPEAKKTEDRLRSITTPYSDMFEDLARMQTAISEAVEEMWAVIKPLED